MKGYAASVEASAQATSVRDLFMRLEACGTLLRVDTNVEPTMFRGSILSRYELDLLRTIEHVVRAGHVQLIQPDRMQMDEREVKVDKGSIFVDCTADGLPSSTARPIFEAQRVTPQGIREGSPSFSAALIGYLEATRGDDLAGANELAPPNAYPNAATDWIRMRHISMTAQVRWDQTPDIGAWAEGCRLRITSGLSDHAGQPGVSEAIGTYRKNAGAAIENLAKLRIEADSAT
jgi:hypothetical protein